LVIATGHHRNGILLAPITADLISVYLLEGRLPERVRPFTPERFVATRAHGTDRSSAAIAMGAQ
jgi:glycine oxidase